MADQTHKRTSSVAVRLGAVASLALGANFVGAVNAKAADMHPKSSQPVATFTDTGLVGKIMPADATAAKQGMSFSNGAAVFPLTKGSLLANGVEGKTNYFIVAGEPPATAAMKSTSLDGKGTGIAVLPGKPSDITKVRLLDTPMDVTMGSMRGDIAITTGSGEAARTYNLRGVNSVVFYTETPAVVESLKSPSGALGSVLQGKLGKPIYTQTIAQPELSKLSPAQACVADQIVANAKTVHDQIIRTPFPQREAVAAQVTAKAALTCKAPGAGK